MASLNGVLQAAVTLKQVRENAADFPEDAYLQKRLRMLESNVFASMLALASDASNFQPVQRLQELYQPGTPEREVLDQIVKRMNPAAYLRSILNSMVVYALGDTGSVLRKDFGLSREQKQNLARQVLLEMQPDLLGLLCEGLGCPLPDEFQEVLPEDANL